MTATNYFTDTRLSLGALGVMSYITHRQQNDKIDPFNSLGVDEIAKGINTDDKSLIQNAVAELISAGYLQSQN